MMMMMMMMSGKRGSLFQEPKKNVHIFLLNRFFYPPPPGYSDIFLPASQVFSWALYPQFHDHFYWGPGWLSKKQHPGSPTEQWFWKVCGWVVGDMAVGWLRNSGCGLCRLVDMQELARYSTVLKILPACVA